MNRRHPSLFSTSLLLVLATACSNKTPSQPLEAFSNANTPEGFALEGTRNWKDIQGMVSGSIDGGWATMSYGHSVGGVSFRPDRPEAALAERTIQPLETPLKALRELIALHGRPDFTAQSHFLSAAEKYDLITRGPLSSMPDALLNAFVRQEPAELAAHAAMQGALGQQKVALQLFYFRSLDRVRTELRNPRLSAEEQTRIVNAAFQASLAEYSTWYSSATVLPSSADNVDIMPSAEYMRLQTERGTRLLDLARKGEWDASIEKEFWASYDRFAAGWRAIVSESYPAWRTENPNAPFADYLTHAATLLAEYSDVIDYPYPYLVEIKWEDNPEFQRHVDAVISAQAGVFQARMDATGLLAAHLPLTSFGWSRQSRTYLVGDYSYAGSCHGEAPASIWAQKPGNPVLMRGKAEADILFDTDDLAVLTAELWATQLKAPVYYAGKRCNLKKEQVERDSNGRLMVEECRDLNPALFHLALVKLVNPQEKGFILERDSFAEVWNTGIVAYDLEYHPIRTRDGRMVEAGIPVPVTDIADADATHRANSTHSLVDVSATVRNTWGDSYTYRYSLELDAEGNLLGGEWGGLDEFESAEARDAARVGPDFLWRMKRDEIAFEKGLIEPALLDRLVECSQRDADTKVAVGESDIEAVSCMP